MRMSRRHVVGGLLGGMLPAATAAQESSDRLGPRPAGDPPPTAKEPPTLIKQIDAGVLNVAYEEAGPASGWPVVLLHGFPYDIHAYDEVTPHLTAAGARVIVPYLRGY